MKRQIQILIAFILLLFAGCFVWSFFISRIPFILPGSVVPYKVSKLLTAFLTILPTVISTAFLVGSSITFGRNQGDSDVRFSGKMFERYKAVIVTALFSVLLMTLGTQVFLPNIENYSKYLIKQPEMFELYVEMAQRSKRFGKDDLAFMYIKRAADMYPENQRAADMLCEYEIGSGYKAEKDEEIPKKNNFDAASAEILPDTCYGLLQKAEDAFQKEDWLTAHYYAQTAVRIASPKDISLNKAEQLAAAAWQKLTEVSNTGDKETQRLFEQKMKGYNALMRGDILEAYYIFAEMKIAQHLSDPDINRYFTVSEQQIKKQFFFTDEYSNLKKYETVSDLYFSIKHKDGSSEIYFMRGATDIREQGNLVRFLRDFSVMYFDSNGKFVKSLTVPYAKMYSVSISVFSRAQQDKLHLPGQIKFVPYILLNSVNRNSNKGISEPEYNYADLPPLSENNYLILSMEYSDFNVLAAASSGAQNMDLFSLYKFVPLAAKYGYSTEIFNTVLQERLLYPFTCLLILLFLTIMAWNYRIDEAVLFKFKWIFTMPVFALLVHIFIQSISYVLRLINFTLVCFVGYQWCLAVTIFVNLLLFFVLSILFLSRKE